MLSSGSARQMNGFASVVLCSAMKRLIAACKSTTEWNTPCFKRRRVIFAKNPSTAFSQDKDVGMKWKVQRGWLALDLHPGAAWVWWDLGEKGVCCGFAYVGSLHEPRARPTRCGATRKTQ